MNSRLDKISLEAVEKRYGPHLIFSGVSFEVGKGDSVCFWGPNGSGKSTLLKITAGLISASAGKVKYASRTKTGPPAMYKNTIGVVAPDVLMYEELTPEENLEFTMNARGFKRDSEYEASLFARFDLEDARHEQVGNFSSGMKQKFHIISALAHKPSALLFDEPSSYMDLSGREQISRIINEMKSEIILIIATNDPEEKDWCNEYVELCN
ncbi:MAG TPA: ABC transporter ATP-binding protein [bacterium]|nr:ABC transporter ATP-binding protein [bacterium]